MRYTGQHEESGLGGMYFYDARWYDPAVSRFLSADTIVPDLSDPQALNRYSYAMNSPVVYIDPSGHCAFGFDTVACILIAINLLAAGAVAFNEVVPVTQRGQPRVENNPNPAEPFGCTASLSTCYQDGRMSDLNSGIVPNDEFYGLLEVVATDLNEGMVLPTVIGGAASGRTTFDTPFYNGGGFGGAGEPPYSSDQAVCVGDQGCWGRSEINYFAQGMWSAEAGESIDDATWYTEIWNETFYGEVPSSGKLYWTKYGYLWYQNWLKWGNNWQDHWEPPTPDNGVTPQ